jgi:hypothetical protein
MSRRFTLSAVLFFVVCMANAQKYELGKISVKELEEKSYSEDSTVAAAITYKKAKSIFKYRKNTGFYMEHQCEFRIKIYKKKGLDWANFSVPYYTGYQELNKDYVEFSNAVTYNLEEGKMVKTKLGGEGRFKKEINENWSEASIVLPNVKVGSVLEFKYTLRTEDITEFPTFFFQYSIPVKYCNYVTEIPGYFIYKPLLCGLGDVVSNAEIVDRSQSFQNENNQSASFSYKAVSNNYTSENIPALKEEEYVDNLQNYRSSLKHELQMTQFPDVDVRHYSTTWEDVAKNIYKDERFGNELKQRQYFESFLAPYIKSGDAPMQRAVSVFNYVQRTMFWDNKYGYLTKKGVKRAYADKTGNVAEINLMLVSMLNHAGVSAYPVLVSTIDNGVAVFPNRGIFNYVIAAAEINGKQVLFDATDKNSAPDILPFRDLNWLGWLIKNDGTTTAINLVPKTPSKKTVTMLAKLNADGNISGKMKVRKTDYLGYSFRESYNGANIDHYLEKLEKGFGGIQIADYKADVPEDAALPIEETFDFTASGAEVIGDKIYIDPLLFFTMTKNPFISEKRNLPIYYGYPYQEKYNLNIEIPPGYEVELIPKTGSIATPENVATFAFNIQSQQNSIQIVATKEINQAIVAADFYEYLKAFYEKMIKSQSGKIVLKKI